MRPGIAVVVAALLAALLPLPSAFVERWYSQGLYPPLQRLVTPLSAAAPVALLDVSVVLLICGAAALALRAWRRGGWRAAVRHVAVALVVGSAVVYLWFLLFWGFNYRRVPLDRKLAYDASRVTRERALSLGRVAVDEVNALRPQIGGVAVGDDGLARALALVEQQLGARRAAAVAAPKRSAVGWYFRKAAIDGMTDPLFLEIILNPDLLPFERPFVLAHEWAHLAGYADESEANFVAWLTCLNGPAGARYSGWLAAYEQLSAALPRDDRRTLRAALSPDVLADLGAVTTRYARSSPTVRTAARGAYDTYLRANRIEEGIANYNAVVRLMVGAAFDSAWTPQMRH